ncbi:predicted protein [Uncinocarpus reesii 1704]|uniref:Uncharacterized protein n=1 Tax=Uncinocarpus reesii (strain UAMH 1704) TaxID=336963 RepID=C4JZC9_UNCRE|nr:uncharacterized protein UREG_07530 [Uncinocarpus reesii 1704]EEP82665.1 predicted protein [Uncinocarpus reesii 1704]
MPRWAESSNFDGSSGPPGSPIQPKWEGKIAHSIKLLGGSRLGCLRHTRRKGSTEHTGLRLLPEVNLGGVFLVSLLGGQVKPCLGIETRDGEFSPQKKKVGNKFVPRIVKQMIQSSEGAAALEELVLCSSHVCTVLEINRGKYGKCAVRTYVQDIYIQDACGIFTSGPSDALDFVDLDSRRRDGIPVSAS